MIGITPSKSAVNHWSFLTFSTNNHTWFHGSMSGKHEDHFDKMMNTFSSQRSFERIGWTTFLLQAEKFYCLDWILFFSGNNFLQLSSSLSVHHFGIWWSVRWMSRLIRFQSLSMRLDSSRIASLHVVEVDHRFASFDVIASTVNLIFTLHWYKREWQRFHSVALLVALHEHDLEREFRLHPPTN